ncbi:hypothetical protein CKAH01_11651 [Colletotrichum kahawae]|uniref:Uncharacterized protein n=1 Tax=Colletotrichum kahawae TaxID=34407 RepID=A0AAE0DDX8_COLKA|nr:hypothetical protein CKAH01_11651 [Colletotrichum kahawae]
MAMLRSKAGPTDVEQSRMAQYHTSPTAILLHWILSTARWLIWVCFGWATSSALFTIFLLGLPFGRQLEGTLRLAYHVIRMELGQTYATFPAGGGTIRNSQQKMQDRC